MTGSPNKSAPNKNNGSKPISSRNNGSKLTFKKNNGDSKVGFGSDNMEYTKKSRKLESQKMFKSEKSKNKKTSKS